jgi:hypothetical protein
LDLEIFSPECALKATYWDKYLVKMCAPFIFLTIFQVAGFMERFVSNSKISLIQNFLTVFWKPYAFLIIGLYTFIVSAAVEPLNCVLQADGSLVLVKQRSETCFQGTWNKFSPAIFFFFILYCFILPGSLAAIFLSHRRQIESRDFQEKFGSLISPYKPRFFFWKVVVLLQRFTFLISNSFLSSQNEDDRHAIGVLFMFFFLSLDVIFSPYRSSHHNFLASS